MSGPRIDLVRLDQLTRMHRELVMNSEYVVGPVRYAALSLAALNMKVNEASAITFASMAEGDLGPEQAEALDVAAGVMMQCADNAMQLAQTYAELSAALRVGNADKSSIRAGHEAAAHHTTTGGTMMGGIVLNVDAADTEAGETP